MKRILSLIAVLLTTFIYSQTTVTGTVVSEDNTIIFIIIGIVVAVIVGIIIKLKKN